MCLTIDIAGTQKYIKRNKNKKWVTVYKFLTKSITRKYYSPFMGMVYRAGYVKPNKDSYKSKDEKFVKGQAIHVFTSLKQTKRYLRLTFSKQERKTMIIVKCYAHMKDLIAVGYYGDLAFKKIFVPKKSLK